MNIRVVNMFRRYGLVSTFMKNEKKSHTATNSTDYKTRTFKDVTNERETCRTSRRFQSKSHPCEQGLPHEAS